VSTTACSNPAGGIRGDAPILAPRVGAWDDGSVGKPAAMLDVDGRVVVYYETGTGIGRAISDDGIAFDRQPTEAPVLEGDFGAPSAIPYGGAVWLAVEVPLDGGATHGVEIHASADAAGESFDGVALALVEPSGDAASFGDPALADYGGAPVLYLTVADESGVTSIGRIALDPVSAVPGPLEIVLAPSLEGLVAPDGVAAPTVTVERGWHEMWFEERNGLDTRIGYAASGDGRLFEPFDSAVLEPSAGAWDALAVGDPSTVIFGGSVLLYYAGRTGSAESIGLVERVLPWIE